MMWADIHEKIAFDYVFLVEVMTFPNIFVVVDLLSVS